MIEGPDKLSCYYLDHREGHLGGTRINVASHEPLTNPTDDERASNLNDMVRFLTHTLYRSKREMKRWDGKAYVRCGFHRLNRPWVATLVARWSYFNKNNGDVNDINNKQINKNKLDNLRHPNWPIIVVMRLKNRRITITTHLYLYRNSW